MKNFLSIGDIQKLLNPMIETYFHASETDSVNLTSIYTTVVELAHHQYQLDKKSIFDSYKLACEKLKEEHPDTPMDDNMEYLQNFTFVALLSYDIYLKTQLVEKIIDEMSPTESDGSSKNGKD